MSMINVYTKCAYDRGYRVDNDGNVISPTGIIRKNKTLKNSKYLCFRISYESKRVDVFVHKLQAYCKYRSLVFDDGVVVRHLNDNPLDNSKDNISIGSVSDNMMDRPKNVRDSCAITASTNVRKFSDKVVKEIKNKRDSGATYKELMEEYDISSKGTLHYLLKTDYKTSV